MNRLELAETIRSALAGRADHVGRVEDAAPEDETGFAGLTVRAGDRVLLVHVYDGEPEGQEAEEAEEAETE